MTELDDPIQVAALFGGGQLRPVWFRWQGRKIEVRQVNLSWRSSQGRAILTHFAVTDGLNLYELTINHQDLTWRLTKSDA